MDWPDVITEGFPPPHQAEPAELRRDIADELADHLACAMRRELRRTDDEGAAERAVLDRFGDPKRLARRLWFDAMKEAIMSQRIMLAAIVLLAAACIAACVFAWLSLQCSQQFNQQMLAELKAMASRPAEARIPSDLATATIRLAEGSEDGKPVLDARVSVDGYPFKESGRETLRASTNSDGVVTFGPVRPGRYRLDVETAAGWSGDRDLLLFGGRDREELVLCPAGASITPPEADVAFALEQVGQFKDGALLLRCSFLSQPFWMKIEDGVWVIDGPEVVLTGTAHVVANCEYKPSGFTRPRRAPELIFRDDDPAVEPQVRWPARQYRLSSIQVFAVSKTRRSSSRRVFTECAKHEYVDRQGPLFEACPGQLNTWHIELPDELLAQVREELQQQEMSDER